VSLDRIFCAVCGSIASPIDARCNRCLEPLPLKEHARDNRVAALYWPVVLRIALAELIYIAVHGSGLL
jgi:predicted amidophosphoribosyltransferase